MIHLIDFFVFFLAWFFQAFTGFGAGIFIVGILSLFHSPHTVIVSSALINFMGTLFMSFSLLKLVKLRWSILLQLIGGSIPGIFIGSYVLLLLSEREVKVLIGAFILLMGIYDLAVQKGKLENFKMSEGTFTTIGVGFIAGVFAGLIGMGGPPPVVYLNQIMKDIDQLKLTLSVFFTSNICFRLLSYQLQGGTQYIDTSLILSSVVAIPLGILLGLYLSRKISTQSLKRFISYSVALLGAGLLIESGLL